MNIQLKKEQIMVNKNFCLKVPVMALVFALLAVWGLEAQTDSRLNGKWVGELEGIAMELTLNNGNFESSSNGVSDSRGTYTSSNGVFTMKPTHVHGGSINASVGFSLFESKWYAINDFIATIRTIFLQYGLSEEDIAELVQLMISPPPSSYSVDANNLTLTSEIMGERIVITYTKR
jgi:hypothetical protein